MNHFSLTFTLFRFTDRTDLKRKLYEELFSIDIYIIEWLEIV